MCHVCMTLLTGVCVSCVYDFVDRPPALEGCG